MEDDQDSFVSTGPRPASTAIRKGRDAFIGPSGFEPDG